MTVQKRDQGTVVSTVAGGIASLGRGVPAGPSRPGTIFKRPNQPFVGDGTHVTLSRIPGMTKSTRLDVPFRFQIPPTDGWQLSAGHNVGRYQVVSGRGTDRADLPGERARKGGANLRTFGFSTFFVDHNPDYAVWEMDDPDPIIMARELMQISLRGIVHRLRVRNTRYMDHDDVNMAVIMETCDISEQPGEPAVRNITMAWVEYVPTELDRRGADRPSSHTIKRNDTLYKLARAYYKNQSLWGVIAAANPGMASWAPSRDLAEWKAKTGHARVKIPDKPKVVGTVERGRVPGLGGLAATKDTGPF